MSVFTEDKPVLYPNPLPARAEIPDPDDQTGEYDDCRRHKKGKKPPPKEIFATADLQILLAGKCFKLSCGHHCTVGHNLANTMIIHSYGGGRIETLCHECGY